MSIDYDITPQRQAYLEARGYTILTACPGSGKTISIVKKLLTVSHYCEEHYGKHTGFACLSFTNKACAELKQKYMELHDERLVFPNEVLTIDSFIMQYVVLPFWYLCDACKKKPIVVNEASILDRIYYNNILINNKWQQYPIMTLRTFASLMHRKNPSLISKDKAGFKWNHKTITDENEIAYCTAAFTYRLEKGFITSSDALWIACDVLDHHQDVAKALVARFPYIIVDEAQDNSELHFEFFKLLKRAGLQNIEFVGDICQSIYGFNNAKSHDVEDKGIPIVVYKYDDGNVRDVIRDFNKICKDNKLSTKMILARGVDKCKTLAGVKDVDFKYWKSELPYLLIDAVLALESSDMDYAFRKMRLVLSDLLTDNSHDAKRQFIHEIEHDIDWNAKIFEFLKKVPPLSLSFKEWSNQTCSLLQTYWGLENRPEFIPYQKKVGYTMKEMADVPVEQYHQSNDNGSEYYKSVDTIHAVKGATLDAVLLFMSADSRGQSISLKDFPSSPVSVMTESQRMIYVACSRARQFLALAVPRSIIDEKIRRALTGVDIDIRNINLQGDLTFTD